MFNKSYNWKYFINIVINMLYIFIIINALWLVIIHRNYNNNIYIFYRTNCIMDVFERLNTFDDKARFIDEVKELKGMSFAFNIEDD